MARERQDDVHEDVDDADHHNPNGGHGHWLVSSLQAETQDSQASGVADLVKTQIEFQRPRQTVN